jgi:hypothetical protein
MSRQGDSVDLIFGRFTGGLTAYLLDKNPSGLPQQHAITVRNSLKQNGKWQ